MTINLYYSIKQVWDKPIPEPSQGYKQARDAIMIGCGCLGSAGMLTLWALARQDSCPPPTLLSACHRSNQLFVPMLTMGAGLGGNIGYYLCDGCRYLAYKVNRTIQTLY